MQLQRRTALLGAASAALALPGCAGLTTASAGKPRHYVLVHGAWNGAWAWTKAALSFTQAVQGDPMAEPLRRSYLKCATNPNPQFKAVAASIQKDARFKSAEVEGHHDIMPIDPQRFVSALLSLT